MRLGRGTLMKDILRALERFPYFYKTLTGIHLVEASPGLRKMQRAALVEGSEDEDVVREKENAANTALESITRLDCITVSWHDGIEFVPEQWSMIMAHEFFDTLPVHSFEKTSEGWREMLIDLDDTDEAPYNFRLTFMDQEPTWFASCKEGDRVEISPDSWDVMTKMAKLIGCNCGVSLAINYGQDHAQGDTLRAICQHKFFHHMPNPGIFLQSLRIQARMRMSLVNAITKEGLKNIIQGFTRLLDPEQMGAFTKEIGKGAKKTTRVPT
ncbi:putative S-adenosyl-L-methionine-dependent methyltransferase-domain-containing protein, partial [Phycomyces nitens]